MNHHCLRAYSTPRLSNLQGPPPPSPLPLLQGLFLPQHGGPKDHTTPSQGFFICVINQLSRSDPRPQNFS